MDLLIITLLSLNLIGLLFLLIRKQPKQDTGTKAPNKLLENPSLLHRELHEIKSRVEQLQKALSQESEERTADYQAVEEALKVLFTLKKQEEAKQVKEEKTEESQPKPFSKPTPITMEKKAKPDTNLQLKNRYNEIFELHKQGLSAAEIAKRLDKGAGEVSLILGLASRKDA